MALTYAGLPCCSCQEKWLPAFEAQLRTHRITVGWAQLIGGYVGSGGTHVGGGASDFVVVEPGPPRSVAGAYDLAVGLARTMGAEATWHRRQNWDGQGGIEHGHSCLRGCPHGTPYYGYQIEAVRAGLNGLANNGPDDGPRPARRRTWRQGLVWAIEQGGAFMALSDKQQEDLYAWVREIVQDTRKVEPRTAKLARLAPGLQGVGDQGDLWPLLRAALAPHHEDDLDEASLAKAIAAAIPETLAQAVADELVQRLKG